MKVSNVKTALSAPPNMRDQVYIHQRARPRRLSISKPNTLDPISLPIPLPDVERP
jgi:hypothetical protein